MCCWFVRMQMIEERVTSHSAEVPGSVLELKEEVDALYDKLEVRHTDQQTHK